MVVYKVEDQYSVRERNNGKNGLVSHTRKSAWSHPFGRGVYVIMLYPFINFPMSKQCMD